MFTLDRIFVLSILSILSSDAMIYFLIGCSSLSSSTTGMYVYAFFSLFLLHSLLLFPPIVLRLRWLAAGTIDFKIRRRTACAPSPPPVVPSTTSFSLSCLSSQYHRCGGTGGRPREHDPGGPRSQHRRVLIISSFAKRVFLVAAMCRRVWTDRVTSRPGENKFTFTSQFHPARFSLLISF